MQSLPTLHVQGVERERRAGVVEVAAIICGGAILQGQTFQRDGGAACNVKRASIRRFQNRGMRDVIGRIGIPVCGRVTAVDRDIFVDVSNLRDDLPGPDGGGEGATVRAPSHADRITGLRLAQRVLQRAAGSSRLRLRAVVVVHIDGIGQIAGGLIDQRILPVGRHVTSARDSPNKRVIRRGMHDPLFPIRQTRNRIRDIRQTGCGFWIDGHRNSHRLRCPGREPDTVGRGYNLAHAIEPGLGRNIEGAGDVTLIGEDVGVRQRFAGQRRAVVIGSNRKGAILRYVDLHRPVARRRRWVLVGAAPRSLILERCDLVGRRIILRGRGLRRRDGDSHVDRGAVAGRHVKLRVVATQRKPGDPFDVGKLGPRLGTGEVDLHRLGVARALT